MNKQDNRPNTRQVTVSEAADILGISTGAVRNRLTRGTLEGVREEGRVFVVLPTDIPEDTRREGALLAHIATLKDALEAERRSPRRSPSLAGRRARTYPAAARSPLRAARILCDGHGGRVRTRPE
jgi:hypothetical protein